MTISEEISEIKNAMLIYRGCVWRGMYMGAFESGNYRNIFLETGKSQKEISERNLKARDIFFFDELQKNMEYGE